MMPSASSSRLMRWPAGSNAMPVLLELTGPARGRWTLGHGAATIRAGTIECLRALPGRNDRPPRPAGRRRPAAAATAAARVVF
jgi:hypothetical protein